MKLNSEKRVHLSIDDIGKSLQWLACNQPGSLFDMRLFGRLRQWHQQYGAKFSLYCFTMRDDFLVSKIPLRYADEFQSSADWLRFGYHGKNGIRFSEYSDYKVGYAAFHHMAKQLKMKTTPVIRLHNWMATNQQKDFLHSEGIEVLLYPDDNSQPYQMNDSFEENGLQHWRTRIRFEHLSEINENTLYIGLERIVAFTHEQFFDLETDKMEKAIQLFYSKRYKFI